jgi:mannosyltransferase
VTRPRLDWAALAILALAAALRLHGLDAESIDLDESSSLYYAARGLRRLFFADPGNPPLYYVLLKGWIALFGTGEVALRMPSVLFGTATVAALYALVRELYDRAAARIAALLLALSTAHIAFSQDGRMYALAALLAVTATHALVRASADGGVRRWVGYAVLAVAMVYTHFSGLLVVLAHGVAVLVVPQLRTRAAVVTGLVVAAAIALGVPIAFARGLMSARHYQFWQPHVSLSALAALSESWIAGVRTEVADMSWPALGLALPALWAARAHRAHLAILYTGLCAFILLAVIKPVWHPRYLAVLLPLFVAGLAVSGRAWLGGLFVAAALAGAAAAKIAGPVGEDWRGVAAAIAEGGGGTVVIVGPDYLCRPLGYYRRGDCLVAADPAAVVERTRGGGTVFVVYPEKHFPADPERRSAVELGRRLGGRADADLRGLHVTSFGVTR